jgi:competence protein ComEC
VTDTDGVFVIDAGPGNALLEFLTQEKIERINAVLISHADEDHVRGVLALLSANTVKIDSVHLNTDSLKGSETWNDLLWELQQANWAGKLQFSVSLTIGDTGKFDTEQIHTEILAPSQYLAARGPGSTDRNGRTITTNSISAVIRLISQDGKPIALFPGDIDEIGLENLRENGISATAPVVIFPHHGGKPGASDSVEFARSFCSLTHPNILVFSIGRGQFKTPRPEIVSVALQLDPTTRIVCTQLSEHCAANIPGVEPAHLNSAFSLGREKRSCCAGTVILSIEDPINSLVPDKEAHSSFISLHAPNALCTRL